jgi:hypothetical protein
MDDRYTVKERYSAYGKPEAVVVDMDGKPVLQIGDIAITMEYHVALDLCAALNQARLIRTADGK